MLNSQHLNSKECWKIGNVEIKNRIVMCPLMYMNNPLCKTMPVITSSNKLRTYTSARYYTDDEILAAITKGGK